MATTNQTVYRLYIALIVFTVLSFILAVSTYLFFSRYSREAALAKEARDALTQKQEELGRSQDEVRRLLTAITDDANANVDKIEADLRTLYETDFNGIAKEPMAYERLVAAIRTEFRALNEARKEADAARETARRKAEDDVGAARKAQDDAEKAKAAAEGERDANRQKWDEDWKKHESELAARLAEREQADDRAKRLETLIARIREAENDVPVERRDDFRAKEAAEEQLEMLLDTLRSTTMKLQERNRLVESLRAAERSDSVVDDLDGRIVEVDNDGRTAAVLFPSTNRIRDGLVFMVFQGGTVDPQVADSKGLAQVIAVEGSLVRVRLTGEEIDNPISPGDWVSSRLWNADEEPEIVMVGFVDLNRDGIEDRRVVDDLLRRVGARVEASVSPTTTLVIDAGVPTSAASEAGREELPRIESRRKKELSQALTYGHRVIGMDEALRLLGVDAATAGGR